MAGENKRRYVGKGGEKLKFAIDALGLQLAGVVAADFGCNVGGFTDCLLQEGASRVYAIDTGHGALEWKLRNDPRVVVMERTNAMHVVLPQPMDVIAIDVAWTPQRHILPAALERLKAGGVILSLFKPQYEASAEKGRHGVTLRRGVVQKEDFESVLETTLGDLASRGIAVSAVVRLPHNRRTKNPEAILCIRSPEGRAT
jgi:23S rRNA (cytidine1920-2'-O)/16S rRNA (cytidine1409-2'-O)-methyltransferase